MDETLFKTLLQALTPQTLAHLACDLGERQLDWDYDPADAPPEALRHDLNRVLQLITTTGEAAARAEGLDFNRLLEQTGQTRRQDEWAWQRNQQVSDNWLSDLT
jgi:hypothetical protein